MNGSRTGTYFASPERLRDDELTREIDIVTKNPVMSGLLHSVSGLLAILNKHRQILAVNDSFLQMLGIEDPGEALGLRPGEAVNCTHAFDEPGGCGTSKFCASCGAAIAIVSSLGENTPAERMCALTVKSRGEEANLALLVKAHPLAVKGNRYILLFLQDITVQQQRAALERTFFHDVNNMLSMLVQASEMLVEDEPTELAKIIHQASRRLREEVSIQRHLSETEISSYQPTWHTFTAEHILEQLELFFANHPVAEKKSLHFHDRVPIVAIKTDISVLHRVLSNMILNALEASTENDEVKVWVEHDDGSVVFCIRNAQVIPEKIRGRIFQRNFSTKEQAGRGIGTYSMKLFGEEILGGQVSFTSSEEEGTVFRFIHPA